MEHYFVILNLVILNTNAHLKELEHRQLSWKVLILKYDLGKSLSKEMWCKMADTKTIFDHIFKKIFKKCM